MALMPEKKQVSMAMAGSNQQIRGDDILLVDTLWSNMKSIEISYKWRCYWRKNIYEWGKRPLPCLIGGG